MRNNIILLPFEKNVISNLIRKEIYAFEKKSIHSRKSVCIPKKAHAFQKSVFIPKKERFEKAYALKKRRIHSEKSLGILENHKKFG